MIQMIFGIRVATLMFGMVYIHDLEDGTMFRTEEACLMENEEKVWLVAAHCIDVGPNEGWRITAKIRFEGVEEIEE